MHKQVKILFTTPVLDYPPAGGPELRIANSIKALNKVSELHIISQVPAHKIAGKQGEYFYQKYSHKFLFSSGNPAYSSSNRLKTTVKAFIYNKLLLKGHYHHLLNYARQNDIRIIWFGYGNISFPLMKKIHKIRPDLKLVCDTDSVWSRFVYRGIPYRSDLQKKEYFLRVAKEKEKEEHEWVEFCNMTTAVSKVDLEYYLSIASNPSKTALFSNGIDLTDYEPATCDIPENFKNNSICLTGSYDFDSAMTVAARWIVNDVIPILNTKIDDFHFYFIGKGSDKFLSDIEHHSVTKTGRVRSVVPYLKNSKLSIVPLFFESGTRFKILEAGACGIPVVSTTLGAEGLLVTHNKDILIADDKECFAQSIADVLNDKLLAKRISDNLKQLVSEKYSIDALAKEAMNILHNLENQ